MTYLGKIKFKMMVKSRKRKLYFFIKKICRDTNAKILDVGVADIEYSPFDNFLEKNYPFPEKITAVSIYPLENFKKLYPSIKAFNYNGGELPFNDCEFDVVYCNAVIEHVGDFNKQIEFVREISRVCKRFFLTTPSRFFPVEMHTNLPLLHYLPKNKFDILLHLLGKKWAMGSYMNLLTLNELKKIMELAEIQNYKIIINRLFIFPMHYYVLAENQQFDLEK